MNKIRTQGRAVVLIRALVGMLLGWTVLLAQQAHGAVSQILTDYFFQNPADLGLIDKQQTILGNVFIAPILQFQGTTRGVTGSARSSTFDTLPYLLTDARFTDKWVLGFNIAPSGYGDLDWGENSIVSHDSTVTKLYYYRIGFQSSYQVTNRFILGLGLNFNYSYLAELDALVGNLGNEVNKVSDLNYTIDAGFLYQFAPKHALVAAIYTPVDSYGSGTSTLGGVTSNDFLLNTVEATVMFIGMQHRFSEQWYLEEKIYWSQWSMQKATYLLNTTRGNVVYMTDWKNTWSAQVFTQYNSSDKLAWMAGATYETNAAPLATNAIAYPLAPSWFFSGGVGIGLTESLSMQLFYGYGFFLPAAQIDNADSLGSITSNTQVGVLQFIYKI